MIIARKITLVFLYMLSIASVTHKRGNSSCSAVSNQQVLLLYPFENLSDLYDKNYNLFSNRIFQGHKKNGNKPARKMSGNLDHKEAVALDKEINAKCVIPVTNRCSVSIQLM
jgi:hypothetical protein